jgi:hypothetical protein
VIFSLSFLQTSWQAPEVKHLQAKMLKRLHQELMRSSPSCMPPYHFRQKFDFDDGIVIVSEATSRKINLVM